MVKDTWSIGCAKKLLGRCKLASKYKVTCHARNKLSKDGSSTLSFGPPGHQKISDPYIKVENSKLSYKTYSMLIRKSWRENRSVTFATLYYQYFDKYRRKTKWLYWSSCLQSIFSKVLKTEHFGLFKVFFSRQEPSNEHTMSSEC